MAKQLQSITPALQSFISEQKIFFVATAADTGRINLSPKGTDSFRIIDSNKVIWLNLTGSGNETAAHLLQHNRMTIMFCAFEGSPMILRLYCTARAHHRSDPSFEAYYSLFEPDQGARQIFEMEVDLVQTSCGMAVPLMDYNEDRDLLKDWATKQGDDGIKAYWKKKNTKSIDGFDTGMI